jgi:SWI/SNF-related matrix-associated actin-dependent regulator 1 of chromatin subfamily A
MYRADPIIDSSPPASPERATYTTQPTQPLQTRSPFFAGPESTQATIVLTPKAVRTSSQLLVPRSSPAPDRPSSPPVSESQTPRPYGFNPMAPPGTSFLPPQAVRKPIFDLTSDDPPVERDSDEDESELRSNIPPSKIELSSRTSRVEV